MKALIPAVVFPLLASCLVLGQAQTEQTPKPGPEVLKLGYYVGTWKGEGETKEGPLGTAGKLSSSMTCEWFTGGFQVVCRGEETGPTGKRAFLNLLSYDQEKKAYTEYSISSFGESEYDSGGSFIGDKLTFLIDADAGGKPAKVRYTEVHSSPDFYTYQAEGSLGGGPWTTIGVGKITKVK
jgi:hypothetical protein